MNNTMKTVVTNATAGLTDVNVMDRLKTQQ